MVSTYVRVASMAAEEAGLSWSVVPTATGTRETLTRHPFGKAPAAEIDGHRFYETVAICQYVDDVHNAGALQPLDPLDRARMSQWLSVANAYIFPATEQGLVLPRLVVPLMGGTPREDLIEKALPTIAYQMTIVSQRLEEASHLAGETYSLADLFMFVILRAVQMTGEGKMILEHLPPLRLWLDRIAERPSVAATAWPDEAARVRG